MASSLLMRQRGVQVEVWCWMSFCWLRRIPAPAVSLCCLYSLSEVPVWLFPPQWSCPGWQTRREAVARLGRHCLMYSCGIAFLRLMKYKHTGNCLEYPDLFFLMVFCKLIKLKYYQWMPLFQNLHTALAMIAWCRMNVCRQDWMSHSEPPQQHLSLPLLPIYQFLHCSDTSLTW